MSIYNLSLWYSSKAKLYWREAEKYLKHFNYPESASLYGDAIEFATKAICLFLKEKHGKKHDISNNLIQISKKKDFVKIKNVLSRLAWISSRWVGMAQRARDIVKYGNYDANIPANRIIMKKDIEPLRSDAKEVCDLLSKFELSYKFSNRNIIKIGILNGYVDELDKAEVQCDVFPYNEFKDITIWEDRFLKFLIDGKNKYNVDKIPISNVNNKYSIIINPFGEAYPEKDVKKRLAFNILRDYVDDGGVLLNTAGFPFFYAWNVNEGRQVPIADLQRIIPTSIRRTEDGRIIEEYQTQLLFAGTLFWKEFDALTTSDTKLISGINQFEVYQKEEDKMIAGDLIDVGGNNKIYEFRALRSETKGLIPLLRVPRNDFGKEVYPIGAIQHGWGYLIVGGMHTKTEAEFEKLVIAVDNFGNWLYTKSRLL